MALLGRYSMSVRPMIGLAALSLATTLTVAPSGSIAAASDPAPGAPGEKADWTEADKTGFGTARARGSNVWFTLQKGRMADTYYPARSAPGVRSLELVVTDGKTFTDRESTDTRQRTTRPDARSLAFTQVNTAKSGRYRITKRFVTDPRRDAVVVRIRLKSLDGKKYRLYAPALDNSGMNDRGWTVGSTLVAKDDDSRVSSALRSRPAFGATSTGYLGRSDGWTD